MARAAAIAVAVLVACAVPIAGCLGPGNCVQAHGDFLLQVTFNVATPTPARMADLAAAVNATGGLRATPFFASGPSPDAAGLLLSSSPGLGTGGSASGSFLLNWDNGSTTPRLSIANFTATVYVAGPAEGNATRAPLETHLRTRMDNLLPAISAQLGQATLRSADLQSEVLVCTFNDGF